MPDETLAMAMLRSLQTASRAASTLCKLANQPAVLICVFLIRCYQGMIRPHLIGSCKFCPTCSEYGIEALQAHGLWRGAVLTIRRICRCHPFAKGGYDPVQPRE